MAEIMSSPKSDQTLVRFINSWPLKKKNKKTKKPKTPHNGGTIFEELDSLVKSTNTFPEYVGGRKEGKKEEKTEERIM